MHHLLKACAAAVLLLWSCNITADNRNGRWEVVTNSDHTVTLLCNGDTLLSTPLRQHVSTDGPFRRSRTETAGPHPPHPRSAG